MLIFPESGPPKGSGENTNRVEHKTWTYLGQFMVFRTLGVIAPYDLVVPKPHTVIEPDECHDSINKWFTFWMGSRCSKRLNKELFQQLQLWKLIKL